MPTFLVRLRSDAIQHVRAATVEMQGDHLVFLSAEGKLTALFLFEIVESWNELEADHSPPQAGLHSGQVKSGPR